MAMEERDNLEKYLEHVYQKHCKLSINESESEFIQKGIETLTLQFLHKTYGGLTCEDTACKINHFKEIELIKVGSFYEGTRNGFPDEFDFIAVFGTVEEEPGKELDSHPRTGICTSCDPYTSGEFPDASMEFQFTLGSRAHGIAERLEYVYTKGKEIRIIDVDITLAVRCNNPEKYLRKECIFNEGFYNEILKTGSFLFIQTRSSVTSDGDLPGASDRIPPSSHKCRGPWAVTVSETEKRFVQDILGEKHRRVYRILKYLVNGCFGEDLFKHLDDLECFTPFPLPFEARFCISSYAIKVAVVHHHYKCCRESMDVGDCVLTILTDLLIYLGMSDRGMVFMHNMLSCAERGSNIAVGTYEFIGNFYWCLKAFITRLASLKTHGGFSKCEHDFENSFLEMALRLDIFNGYLQYLSAMNRKYSDPRVLWPIRTKFDRLVEKVKQYNEKRNVISDCPWCDYPVFILANKRKL